MQRAQPKIKPCESIIAQLANLATGDIVYIDIDETLVYNGTHKYEAAPQLTEAQLDKAIGTVQERGISVIGLTARHADFRDITQVQLAKLNIELNEIIHAPSVYNADGQEIPQKSGALLQSLRMQREFKRIFVIDNNQLSLQDILQNCAHLPIYLKHYVPLAYQPILINATTNAFFPRNLDGFILQESLGGGTRSTYKIFNPATGQTLVLKYGAHDDAGRIEILCKATYQALGVNVPLMRVYHVIPKTLAKSLHLSHTTGMFQVSEYIAPHANQSQKIIAEAAANDYIAHFVVDNTDIMKTDNFMRDQEDKVYLIDAGSNFLFGGLGNYRLDANKMHNTVLKVQEYAPNWYGHLSEENFREQTLRLVEKHRDIEATVWQTAHHLRLSEEMRNQFLQHLAERLDYIMMRFSCLPQTHALQDKLATPKYTAAGVLTCVTFDNDLYVLLSKRRGSGLWDNMGGKSDAGDVTLINTAKREVFEESSGVLNYTTTELEACPFHDLVWLRRGKLFTYRMYISHTNPFDIHAIKDHEHTEHVWLPLANLLDASHDYTLLPDFAAMLNQEPVYQHLHNMLAGKQLAVSHTLSYRGMDTLDDTSDAFDYRPMAVPQQKRRQIAKTLLQQSRVLRELKASHIPFTNPFNPVACDLLQAEIHLQALLGNDFIPKDDYGNLERFVESKYKREGSFADLANRQRLTEIVNDFMQHERANPELIDCFHACNHIVSFTYKLYSSIYEILNACDDWRALRIDTGQFRYRSIQEFIAYFSDDGKHPINNNEADYHECAISANIFPFGNHKTPTSSSPHYLMENDVRRDVLLPQLLESLFKPFHITSLEIKRILKVFDRIKHFAHETIYQISLTRQQAHEMAYVSGSAGVLNPFGGTYRLDEVLDALRVADLTDSTVKKFITHAQLRLMVPPDVSLQVNEVRWQELPEAIEALYRQELADCAQFIAEMMIRHHKEYGNSNTKTLLLRQLPSILLANQLGALPSISDNIIANAIRAQDEIAIIRILKAYPEYRTKVFAIDKVSTYLKSNSWHHSKHQGARKVLDWVIHCTQLPLANIIACFNDTWLDELGDVNINYYEEFQSLLKRLPETLRLPYFNRKWQQTTDKGFISNQNIIEYFTLFAESVRAEFVRLYPELFHQLGYRGFNDCLAFIPDAERMDLCDFICPYLQYGYDIPHIAEMLAPAQQYPFLLRNKQYLRNGYDVSEALCYVPLTERQAFALSLSHVYQDSFGTNEAIEKMDLQGDPLTTFLLQVIPNFKPGETDVFWLLNILRLVQPSDRLLIAEKFTALFTPANNRVFSFTELLLPADRLAYAETNLAFLETYHFTQVVQYFTAEEALYFARKYADRLTDGTFLGFILNHLPDNACLPFAQENHQLIQNMNQLAHVCEHLHVDSAGVIAFIESVIPRIADHHNFPHLLGRIPATHRLSYIERLHHCLRDAENLDLMLYFTPIGQRFSLALQHAHLINDSRLLRVITLKLPEEMRVVFVSHSKLSHINRQFNCVMDDLNAEDKLLLAICMQHHMTDRYLLKATTLKLPVKDRLPFLHLYRSRYTSLYDGEELSLCLEGSDKLVFIAPYLSLVSGKEELQILKAHFTGDLQTLLAFINLYQAYQHPNKTVHVTYFYWLKSLKNFQRLGFITANIDKLLSETTIGQLFNEVPNENQTEFAMAYHHCINDYASLSKLLPALAEDKRAQVVADHLPLIDSDMKLRLLLKHITHSHQLLKQWQEHHQPPQPFNLFQPLKCKPRHKKQKSHVKRLGTTQ